MKGLRIIGSHDSFKTRIHSETKPSDAQQFCYGFKGSYVLCKIEQKHIISCLKYNTISTSYLLNCCIKSHLHSCKSGQKRHSCDIAVAARVISLIWYKYETKRYETYKGILFAPISWILGHNCIYVVVALHHICIKYFNRVIFFITN